MKLIIEKIRKTIRYFNTRKKQVDNDLTVAQKILAGEDTKEESKQDTIIQCHLGMYEPDVPFWVFRVLDALIDRYYDKEHQRRIK